MDVPVFRCAQIEFDAAALRCGIGEQMNVHLVGRKQRPLTPHVREIEARLVALQAPDVQAVTLTGCAAANEHDVAIGQFRAVDQVIDRMDIATPRRPGPNGRAWP